MGQRIIPLSECPQFADVCAAWAFGQWGSQHGGSLERTQQRFAQCSRPSDDHLTLMMIDGDRPVGMASLWPSDDHQRQDLTRGWPASSCIPITAARALPTAWRWRSSKRRGSAIIRFCISSPTNRKRCTPAGVGSPWNAGGSMTKTWW